MKKDFSFQMEDEFENYEDEKQSIRQKNKRRTLEKKRNRKEKLFIFGEE